MRQPASLPPIGRSPSFSTYAAQLAGVNRSRLRRADLVSPFHGVRRNAADQPITVEERCKAYATVMPEGMFFSHTTAATLYGLPLPALDSAAIHVAAPRHRRAPRAQGVVGHRVTVAEEDVRSVRGLRVPRPEEVLCQLASLLDHDALVRVGDAMVRRKLPLSTMEQLSSAVSAAEARPGVRTLRQALESVRARTDSPMETTLRLAIIRGGLPEPLVNHRIGLGANRVAHLDLAYPDRRIAIEYDGDHHRTDDRQFHIDGDRLWRIEAAGWRVIRVNRSHMSDGAHEAVRRVRLALTSMGRNTP